jgi:WD40 repeat protein
VRKIAKSPFKILEAPTIQDDFYLNLVDWSSQNMLAVGLGSCVYLWNAVTNQVNKLCDIGSDLVTSVGWMQTVCCLIHQVGAKKKKEEKKQPKTKNWLTLDSLL